MAKRKASKKNSGKHTGAPADVEVKPSAPTSEQVRLRAYEISLERGDGDEVSHWLEAERELVAGRR